MLIIPAIDLQDGKCVRLQQGNFNRYSVFGDDPLLMAERWFDYGISRLHIVDLDGAKGGAMRQQEIIGEIAQAYPDKTIQVGGGIRDLSSIEKYLNKGVSYVILGTQAVRNPEFAREAATLFPQKIIVGMDARNGLVATDGWLQQEATTALELTRYFSQSGIAAIIYTDIARDGMLNGVNINETLKIAETTNIPTIASGGISSLQDIKELQQHKNKIAGVIVGSALYQGKLDLQQALDLLKNN